MCIRDRTKAFAFEPWRMTTNGREWLGLDLDGRAIQKPVSDGLEARQAMCMNMFKCSCMFLHVCAGEHDCWSCNNGAITSISHVAVNLHLFRKSTTDRDNEFAKRMWGRVL